MDVIIFALAPPLFNSGGGFPFANYPGGML
jgi:hypothetical protein